MKWLVVAAAVFAVGCSSVKPLPIVVGDRCYRCQRPIDDLKFAAEMIDEGGHAFKFRTAGCLAKYLAEHKGEHTKGLFVTDYATGKFIATSRAHLVPIVVNRASLEKDYASFSSASDAEALAKKEGSGATMAWDAVVAAAATP
ncbi:MAG TPA: nitrous oxide reductase accessory protein NosL [Vicinamibacterales bacterium]|nr:nitrous oxide reductase accessory protein NosL [Vicinamibacterales bacterium]